MLHFICRVVSYLILVLLIVITSISVVAAQSDNFILEVEKNWETYRVGGTCISGGNNIFVGNIDSDTQFEIITGGSSYSLLANGSTGNREAPLRIWNWDGKNLSLKLGQNWLGSISCVYSGDVDGDGQMELFTAGTERNETGACPSLIVWNWDGSSLSPKARVDGIPTTAVCVNDVDRDGKKEIISVGRFNNTGRYGAKLYLWSLENGSLTLKSSVDWCLTNVTSVSSVASQDLDGDGNIEIVTGGTAYDLKNSSGHLRIWQYDGKALSIKANEEWRLKEGVYGLTISGGVQGNTGVNNLKVGDVDGDGTLEVVTGGFACDGQKVVAQLRVWGWSSSALVLESTSEWTTDYLTEVKSVSLNDVDGDSQVEIITSGITCAEGSFVSTSTVPEQAQLRVWSLESQSLRLEQGKDWWIDEGACAWSVGSGDVDGDGVKEIVTVGCTYFSNLCDPDMRIWSLPQTGAFPVFYAIAGGIIVVSLLSGVLWMRARRK
jgi:LPXTG-motif cell wall-anchored protein